jgi:hypothetical protein
MDRLEELKETAKTVDAQFKGSLFRFEADTNKPDPRALMRSYEAFESKITLIQGAQATLCCYSVGSALYPNRLKIIRNTCMSDGGKLFAGSPSTRSAKGGHASSRWPLL